MRLPETITAARGGTEAAAKKEHGNALDGHHTTAAVAAKHATALAERDNALTSLAGTLRRRGLAQETIRSMLEPVNATCDPPMAPADLDRIAKSVSRYAPDHPLVRQAIHDGEMPDDEAHDKPAFQLIRAGDLEITAPDWLIEDRLEVDTLGLIFGDPGSGKSFLGVDAG